MKSRFVELCEMLLPQTNAKNLFSLVSILRDRSDLVWINGSDVFFEGDYLWHLFKDQKPRITKQGGVFKNAIPELLEVISISKQFAPCQN